MSEQKKTTNKKGKKRANGEGTFYQLEDRTWVHQITLGRKPDGKLDRKTFTGETRTICIERREAYKEQKEQEKLLEQERLVTLTEDEKRGHSLESETLFSEAFPEWLKLYKAPPTRKSSTYTSYLNIYDVHYNGYFGEKMLFEITQDVVQQYYKEKQLNGARKDGKEGGLSPKTIRNHHMILKDFFRYALKKYKLTDNPTLDTDRPEVHTPKMRVLDQDEMVLFLKEVIRETQRTAILFDFCTGLRAGELLPLEVSDLNPKTQSIEIQRNLVRVSTDAINLGDPNIRIINYDPNKKTHVIIQESPKTDASNRVIPLSDDLFELLFKHLLFIQQSDWPNPYNLLFPSTKGTYLDPKSYEIRLTAISKRCEMKKVNPHALRHTFATRLIEQDVALTTVKELMGHTSVATTQKYVTTFDREKREAIGVVAQLWNLDNLAQAAPLNGAKKQKMKFADVRLPSWLQTGPS